MVVIELSVVVFPQTLNETLFEKVREKAKWFLLNKEVRNVGFIKSINKIDIDDNSFHILYTGNIKCKTLVDADVYLPKLGDIITTKIKSVSLHGYYLDEPLETFVMISKDENPKKEGEPITVKITKVNYTNDHFIILANKNSP